ncbi:LacI family DNA-binding transcriptional regulator [candidate division KSB1 bacterium]|nr:LacI family DNA-binding transcriptional regulator [candidate division KSB1 bacterium]
MHITIDDVAKVANVSKATVSAVINNRPGISDKTRMKVMKVIKKLNYRPNQVARSLSIKETKTIGLLIKEINNPFFGKVMKGVFDTCSMQDYTVLLGSSELSPEKQTGCIETLTSQRVDGLIISPLQGADVDFGFLVDLLRTNYPFVMLDRIHNYTTNLVDINNQESAYNAVKYLLELGHTRIAYFAGPPYSAHDNDRLVGYQNALVEHGVPVRKNYTVPVGSYIENGYEAGIEFFSSIPELPTAVLCFNDLSAIGLINALLELNLRVPDDVSVIGFDDIEFCSSVKIPLTTVRIPAFDIGKTATDLLIEQIANRNNFEVKSILLDAPLIIRNSCAPPK